MPAVVHVRKQANAALKQAAAAQPRGQAPRRPGPARPQRPEPRPPAQAGSPLPEFVQKKLSEYVGKENAPTEDRLKAYENFGELQLLKMLLDRLPRETSRIGQMVPPRYGGYVLLGQPIKEIVIRETTGRLGKYPGGPGSSLVGVRYRLLGGGFATVPQPLEKGFFSIGQVVESPGARALRLAGKGLGAASVVELAAGRETDLVSGGASTLLSGIVLGPYGALGYLGAQGVQHLFGFDLPSPLGTVKELLGVEETIPLTPLPSMDAAAGLAEPVHDC